MKCRNFSCHKVRCLCDWLKLCWNLRPSRFDQTVTQAPSHILPTPESWSAVWHRLFSVLSFVPCCPLHHLGLSDSLGLYDPHRFLLRPNHTEICHGDQDKSTFVTQILILGFCSPNLVRSPFYCVKAFKTCQSLTIRRYSLLWLLWHPLDWNQSRITLYRPFLVRIRPLSLKNLGIMYNMTFNTIHRFLKLVSVLRTRWKALNR